MNLSGYKFKSETFRQQIAEERADEAAKLILKVLAARGIPVNEAIRTKIGACTDLSTLETWIERAATVSSAEDVVSN